MNSDSVPIVTLIGYLLQMQVIRIKFRILVLSASAEIHSE